MTEPASFISARPRIAVNGEARADLQAAVLFMRVNMPFSGMAHAEVRLVNWGTNSESNGEAGYAFQDIALGDRLEIGAGDTQSPLLFTGEVTAIEEVYGQGAPRLVLLLEDKLHRLAKLRNNRVFESVSVNELVQTLLSDVNLTGDIQVSTDRGVWHQLNETGLGFLLRVLAPYGIPLRYSDNNVRVKADEEDNQPVTIDTQSGVTSLRIIADTNRQPRALSVQGFNLDADENARGNSQESGASGGTDARQTLTQLSWAGDEILAYPPARHQAEANAWARAAMRSKAQTFLHGELIASGNAQLRTGKQIELNGASARLNGKYHILQAQHLFDTANGYQTRVKIARASWNR